MEGDEEEEEVLEQRKRMWPEVIIPVAGPSQVATPLLKDAIWALLKKVAGHLGTITSEVKRIRDEVCKVKEDRRTRKRLQVGVQTKVHEVTEVGVGEEEVKKGKEIEDGEDGDKDVLKNDIVMSSSLFMLITYYSVMMTSYSILINDVIFHYLAPYTYNLV